MTIVYHPGYHRTGVNFANGVEIRSFQPFLARSADRDGVNFVKLAPPGRCTKGRGRHYLVIHTGEPTLSLAKGHVST